LSYLSQILDMWDDPGRINYLHVFKMNELVSHSPREESQGVEVKRL